MSERILPYDPKQDESLELFQRAAAKGECDCECDPHEGDVHCVRVLHLGDNNDWGWFAYCQAAIEQDRKNGFLVFSESEWEARGEQP